MTTWRSWWSEGPHPRGNRRSLHVPDTGPGFACHRGWTGYGWEWPVHSLTSCGGTRPEGGAGCVSAHVRICPGPPGKTRGLPGCASGQLAKYRRWKSSMIKEVTDPHHFPSRAVIPAREWAKRRQGRMWVGLLSAEKFVVQSAEAFSIAEGNTACTALVRCGRALRRPRTHARMYVRGWDLRGLSAAQRQGRGRQSEGSSRSMDERRREVRCGSISCEADEQSVDDHMAELVERRTAPKGKPQIPARSGHRAGLCVSQGMDRLRLGVACPLSNVMRWHATRGRSRMR